MDVYGSLQYRYGEVPWKISLKVVHFVLDSYSYNVQLEIFLIPSHTAHRRTRPVKCWPLQSAKVEAPSEPTPSLMAPYGQRNIDTNVCLGFWSQNKKGWEKTKTLYYIPLVWLLKSSSLYHWNHPFLHWIDYVVFVRLPNPPKQQKITSFVNIWKLCQPQRCNLWVSILGGILRTAMLSWIMESGQITKFITPKRGIPLTKPFHYLRWSRLRHKWITLCIHPWVRQLSQVASPPISSSQPIYTNQNLCGKIRHEWCFYSPVSWHIYQACPNHHLPSLIMAQTPGSQDTSTWKQWSKPLLHSIRLVG